MFKGKDYDINDYCLYICDEYGVVRVMNVIIYVIGSYL